VHDSVMHFIRANLPKLDGIRVLEVGSYNVNGSVRPLIELDAVTYTGTDMRPGPGVDVVCDAADVGRLGVFDLVISTEMLEHAEDWQEALRGIVRATRLNGDILLTTRGPGAGYHAHPEDHWRFTPEILDAAFTRLGVFCDITRDPGQGYEDGVFVAGVRFALIDDELSDLVADVPPPPPWA